MNDNLRPSLKQRRNSAAQKRSTTKKDEFVSRVEERLRVSNPGQLAAIKTIAEEIARTKAVIFMLNSENAEEVARLSSDLTKLSGTAFDAAKKAQRDAKRRQSARFVANKKLAYREGLEEMQEISNGRGSGQELKIETQRRRLQKSLSDLKAEKERRDRTLPPPAGYQTNGNNGGLGSSQFASA
jgi:hypothetical protein